MAFTHFGESADQYVLTLERRSSSLGGYGYRYLRYLRTGGQVPKKIGINANQAKEIEARLRNTGTAQDFAHRAIGGTVGTFRSKHFTADEWVGKPGREWRNAHRCRYPHNSSEANSRTNCPEWRHVAPSPAAIDRELYKLHNRPKGMLRTKSRAARRRGER